MYELLKTWKILYTINKHKRTEGTGALRAPVVAVFLDLFILCNIFQVLSNYYTQNLPLGCFGLNNLGFCQQPRLMQQSDIPVHAQEVLLMSCYGFKSCGMDCLPGHTMLVNSGKKTIRTPQAQPHPHAPPRPPSYYSLCIKSAPPAGRRTGLFFEFLSTFAKHARVKNSIIA